MVVCCGDGGIRAAAPGVMQSGLHLSVIPIGATNDFARTLGLPDDPAEAAGVVGAEDAAVDDARLDL